MSDPLADDITRRPHLYRDFAGAAVRIRVFWSAWWFRPKQRSGLMQSHQLISNADAVLRNIDSRSTVRLLQDFFRSPAGHFL